MVKSKQKQKQSQSVVVNVNAPKRRTRKSAPKPPRQPERQPPSLSPYGKFADPFIPREYKPPTLTELLTALRQPAPVKVAAPSIEKTPTATTAPSLGSKAEKSLPKPLQPPQLQPLQPPQPVKEKTISSALNQSFFGIPEKIKSTLLFGLPKPQSLPSHGLEDDPLERDGKTPSANVFVSPTPPVSIVDDLAARKKLNLSTGLPPPLAAPPVFNITFNTASDGKFFSESGGLPAPLAPKEEQPKTSSTLVPQPKRLIPETESFVDTSKSTPEVLSAEEEQGFVDVEEEEPFGLSGFFLSRPEPTIVQGIPEPKLSEPLSTATPAPQSAVSSSGSEATFTEPSVPASNVRKAIEQRLIENTNKSKLAEFEKLKAQFDILLRQIPSPSDPSYDAKDAEIELLRDRLKILTRELGLDPIYDDEEEEDYPDLYEEPPLLVPAPKPPFPTSLANVVSLESTSTADPELFVAPTKPSKEDDFGLRYEYPQYELLGQYDPLSPTDEF